jgi:hypothetical protein
MTNCEHITKCEKCGNNICSYCVEDCDGCSLEGCEACFVAHMKHCGGCTKLVCPQNFAGKVCLTCDAQSSLKREN